MSKPLSVTRHPVRVSHDAEAGRLLVCEYGSVPEERMADQCIDVDDGLRFFLRRPRGTVMGFEVVGLEEIDVEARAPDLWGDPRFRVPALGLRRASVGEIVLRARSVLGDRSTADVSAERRGHALLVDHDHVGAEAAFRDVLDAGELRAHLRLPPALCGQGRYAEAYDHARIFTELAPRNSWGWAWLGRVCAELEETRGGEERAAARGRARASGELPDAGADGAALARRQRQVTRGDTAFGIIASS